MITNNAAMRWAVTILVICFQFAFAASEHVSANSPFELRRGVERGDAVGEEFPVHKDLRYPDAMPIRISATVLPISRYNTFGVWTRQQTA